MFCHIFANPAAGSTPEGTASIETQNKGKNHLRPFGHRSVESGLGFCFQQKWHKGGGVQKSGDRVIRNGGDISRGKHGELGAMYAT
jgi:hypothetical protein